MHLHATMDYYHFFCNQFAPNLQSWGCFTVMKDLPQLFLHSQGSQKRKKRELEVARYRLLWPFKGLCHCAVNRGLELHTTFKMQMGNQSDLGLSALIMDKYGSAFACSSQVKLWKCKGSGSSMDILRNILAQQIIISYNTLQLKIWRCMHKWFAFSTHAWSWD